MDLLIKTNTEIKSNNLPEYAKEIRATIANVNTDLKTDEDFAEAKENVKSFKKAEDSLKQAKEHIFETGGLAELNKLINELGEECREVRLSLNRTITTKDKEVKQNMIDDARNSIHQAFNYTPVSRFLTVDYSDVAEQIKGKRSIEKMKEALDRYVGVKINAIQVEETALLAKQESIELLIKDHASLFSVDNLMRIDDYQTVIANRIDAHNKEVEEQAKARQKAEQEKIKVEQAKQNVADQEKAWEPQKTAEQSKVTAKTTGHANIVNSRNHSKTEKQKSCMDQFEIKVTIFCTEQEARTLAREIKDNISYKKSVTLKKSFGAAA